MKYIDRFRNSDTNIIVSPLSYKQLCEYYKTPTGQSTLKDIEKSIVICLSMETNDKGEEYPVDAEIVIIGIGGEPISTKKDILTKINSLIGNDNEENSDDIPGNENNSENENNPDENQPGEVDKPNQNVPPTISDSSNTLSSLDKRLSNVENLLDTEYLVEVDNSGKVILPNNFYQEVSKLLNKSSKFSKNLKIYIKDDNDLINPLSISPYLNEITNEIIINYFKIGYNENEDGVLEEYIGSKTIVINSDEASLVSSNLIDKIEEALVNNKGILTEEAISDEVNILIRIPPVIKEPENNEDGEENEDNENNDNDNNNDNIEEPEEDEEDSKKLLSKKIIVEKIKELLEKIIREDENLKYQIDEINERFYVKDPENQNRHFEYTIDVIKSDDNENFYTEIPLPEDYKLLVNRSYNFKLNGVYLNSTIYPIMMVREGDDSGTTSSTYTPIKIQVSNENEITLIDTDRFLLKYKKNENTIFIQADYEFAKEKFEIYHVTDYILGLDYLPDEVLTKNKIQDQVKEIVVTECLADWKEIDKNSPKFIENKPFGEDLYSVFLEKNINNAMGLDTDSDGSPQFSISIIENPTKSIKKNNYYRFNVDSNIPEIKEKVLECNETASGKLSINLHESPQNPGNYAFDDNNIPIGIIQTSDKITLYYSGINLVGKKFILEEQYRKKLDVDWIEPEQLKENIQNEITIALDENGQIYDELNKFNTIIIDGDITKPITSGTTLDILSSLLISSNGIHINIVNTNIGLSINNKKSVMQLLNVESLSDNESSSDDESPSDEKPSNDYLYLNFVDNEKNYDNPGYWRVKVDLLKIKNATGSKEKLVARQINIPEYIFNSSVDDWDSEVNEKGYIDHKPFGSSVPMPICSFKLPKYSQISNNVYIYEVKVKIEEELYENTDYRIFVKGHRSTGKIRCEINNSTYFIGMIQESSTKMELNDIIGLYFKEDGKSSIKDIYIYSKNDLTGRQVSIEKFGLKQLDSKFIPYNKEKTITLNYDDSDENNSKIKIDKETQNGQDIIKLYTDLTTTSSSVDLNKIVFKYPNDPDNYINKEYDIPTKIIIQNNSGYGINNGVYLDFEKVNVHIYEDRNGITSEVSPIDRFITIKALYVNNSIKISGAEDWITGLEFENENLLNVCKKYNKNTIRLLINKHYLNCIDLINNETSYDLFFKCQSDKAVTTDTILNNTNTTIENILEKTYRVSVHGNTKDKITITEIENNAPDWEASIDDPGFIKNKPFGKGLYDQIPVATIEIKEPENSDISNTEHTEFKTEDGSLAKLDKYTREYIGPNVFIPTNKYYLTVYDKGNIIFGKELECIESEKDVISFGMKIIGNVQNADSWKVLEGIGVVIDFRNPDKNIIKVWNTLNNNHNDHILTITFQEYTTKRLDPSYLPLIHYDILYNPNDKCKFFYNIPREVVHVYNLLENSFDGGILSSPSIYRLLLGEPDDYTMYYPISINPYYDENQIEIIYTIPNKKYGSNSNPKENRPLAAYNTANPSLASKNTWGNSTSGDLSNTPGLRLNNLGGGNGGSSEKYKYYFIFKTEESSNDLVVEIAKRNSRINGLYLKFRNEGETSLSKEYLISNGKVDIELKDSDKSNNQVDPGNYYMVEISGTNLYADNSKQISEIEIYFKINDNGIIKNDEVFIYKYLKETGKDGFKWIKNNDSTNVYYTVVNLGNNIKKRLEDTDPVTPVEKPSEGSSSTPPKPEPSGNATGPDGSSLNTGLPSVPPSQNNEPPKINNSNFKLEEIDNPADNHDISGIAPGTTSYPTFGLLYYSVLMNTKTGYMTFKKQ
ncbi:MAG: hypothetical protein J1F35_03695 [Erysipelotrichales bacterium]|nr:hypothetical protein [Erysipelotrichales bacterium]